MTRVLKITKPSLVTPMAARYVTVLSENKNSGLYTVDYASDEDFRHPVRINVSPNAMVLSREDLQRLVGEAKTPVAAEPMQKIKGSAQDAQKPRTLRKAKDGHIGDKDHDDEIEQRGAMKFPHSDAEEEWADHIKWDPEKNTWDYPTYRQTGIDDSMFIFGREAENQMKKGVKESVVLDSKGLV